MGKIGSEERSAATINMVLGFFDAQYEDLRPEQQEKVCALFKEHTTYNIEHRIEYVYETEEDLNPSLIKELRNVLSGNEKKPNAV